MKKFLSIAIGLLGIALLVVIAVFLYIHNIASSTPQNTGSDTAPRASSTDSSEMTEETKSEAGIPLKDVPMSDSQKKALETVGVNSEEFVLTPAMIACGTEKLGEERVAEIIAGDAPTMLEMARLTPCLGAE